MVWISSQIGQETRSNGLDIQSDWTEDPLRMSRSSRPFHLDIFPTVRRAIQTGIQEGKQTPIQYGGRLHMNIGCDPRRLKEDETT